MRAIIQPTYGSPDVLALREIAKPAVGDDDVLVRVHAASVGKGDVHLLTGKPYLIRLMGYGFRRPKKPVPGHAIAGRVEAVGKNVTEYRPGDDVFGEIDRGAFAEFVCAPQEVLAPKPASLTFAQAAALPVSATTALQGLRDLAGVKPGDDVLINGASGGVGTFAIQIAKALGATVTGVCSTRNVERARELGADDVVDYTQADFVESGKRYDVFFDMVGNRSMADVRRVLEPKGVYVAGADQDMGDWIGPIAWMLRVSAASWFRSQQTRTFVNNPTREDLLTVSEMVVSGTVVPFIERTYTLDEVPEAVRYMATGHAQGKLVVTI